MAGSGATLFGGIPVVDRPLLNEVFFHIAQVTVDPMNGSVQLSVDMSARDLQTLQAVWDRDRAAILPSMIANQGAAASTAVLSNTQSILWDCDAGAGRIPRMGIQAELWNVIRIPAGQRGIVQQSILAADDPCEMSWAIFDRPITDVYLRSLGNPLDEGYWTDFPRDAGLTVAWGNSDNPGGYWPGLKSNDDIQTGIIVDQGPWNFESQQAPWMWVAVWTDSDTFVQGKIQPYFSNLPTPAQIAVAADGTGQGFGNL